MKNTFKKPVVISIVLHALLISLISYFGIARVHLNKNNSKAPAIKSYLYQKPRSITEDRLLVEPTKEIKNETPKLELEAKTKEKVDINSTPDENEPPLKKDTHHKQANEINPEISLAPASKGISTQQQIEQLRSKINRDSISQFALPKRRANSGSPLHGESTLVPHSKKSISRDEQLKAATLDMGPNSQIIKGDNGTCTVINDLSVVGMEGIKSVQSFSCGENKFDRSFREHMKQVRAKLGKN